MDDAQKRYEEALAFQAQGDFEAAIALHDKLLLVHPSAAPIHSNRGLSLQHLERYEEAIVSFNQAIAHDARYAFAYNQRGKALYILGHLNEALRDFQHALSIRPNMAQAHDESRLQVKQSCYGQNKDLATPVPLMRLFKQSFDNTGIEIIVDGAEISQAYNFHCPLMSLPLACGTNSVGEIPAEAPYLFSSVQGVQTWLNRLNEMMLEDKPKQRIGLCWASSARPDLHKDRDRRSLHVSQMKPLLDVICQQKGLAFSLQMDEPAKQLKQLQIHDWKDFPIFELASKLTDWADTAALVANLDLVITCCTAVAHLAAAMGKPTWILLHDSACWRWLQDRDDSPWYPTVRLFRQKERGNWDIVIAEVAQALLHTIKP